MESQPKQKVYPNNPLGIIATFVFFIEAISASSLYFLRDYFGLLKMITIFIIAFPSSIAVIFFLFLWIKREALYSPGDYHSDESFLKLNNRLSVITQATQVSEVLPQEIGQVFHLLDNLVANDEIRSAIKIGRGYLKSGENGGKIEDFKNSLNIFQYLKKRVSVVNSLYYKIPTNIAYINIELGDFDAASENLEEAIKRLNGNGEMFQLVPLLYCYFKMNREQNQLESLIQKIKQHQDYDKFAPNYKKRYPELKFY